MTIYYKDKTLPNRFKECRIASNLTQAELGKLLGFNGKNIQFICMNPINVYPI